MTPLTARDLRVDADDRRWFLGQGFVWTTSRRPLPETPTPAVLYGLPATLAPHRDGINTLVRLVRRLGHRN